jgi:hypothetical protein
MYEVHVARYYMKRKAYVAAVDRASTVIEKYQRTPAVPYALQVLQEAYTKLEMSDLASDATRVYELNYPNGPACTRTRQFNTFSQDLGLYWPGKIEMRRKQVKIPFNKSPYCNTPLSITSFRPCRPYHHQAYHRLLVCLLEHR